MRTSTNAVQEINVVPERYVEVGRSSLNEVEIVRKKYDRPRVGTFNSESSTVIKVLRSALHTYETIRTSIDTARIDKCGLFTHNTVSSIEEIAAR